jgi:hypothetical protein
MDNETQVRAYQVYARNQKVQALIAQGMPEEEAEVTVPPINTESQEARQWRLSKKRQYEDQ